MDLQLADKTAIVTGGSQGIGRATAKLLAAEGVRVAVVARRLEILNEDADAIEAAGHPRPFPIQQDIMEDDAAAKIVAAAREALGPIDIMMNIAGGSRKLALDASEEEWEESFTINFKRVRQLAHAVLPEMMERGFGRIINVTSKNEPEITPGKINAAMTAKASVHMWAKGLSREVASKGVTVNCIAPGKIMSEQIRRNYSEEVRERMAREEIPAGYLGEPEDLGVLAVFLASPLARYITGTVMPVDGSFRRYAF